MNFMAVTIHLQISLTRLASSSSGGENLNTSYLPDWRIWLIAIIIVIGIVLVGLQNPVPQDPEYHNFADQRALFHVPNFWNVVSNLLFLAAGAAGLIALYARKCPGAIPVLRSSYGVFFIGSALVAIGSAYYHLSPNNETLAWDRFAMTVAFMAFLAIILGEHINPRLGHLSLPPLLIIGLLSVLVWSVTEAREHGDLRFYILVQFLPFILIPLIVILFPSKLTRIYFVWGILLCYGIGKVLEFFDAPIYRTFHLSGHTLKHLIAAVGVFFFVFAIQKRKVIPSSAGDVSPELKL